MIEQRNVFAITHLIERYLQGLSIWQMKELKQTGFDYLNFMISIAKNNSPRDVVADIFFTYIEKKRVAISEGQILKNEIDGLISSNPDFFNDEFLNLYFDRLYCLNDFRMAFALFPNYKDNILENWSKFLRNQINIVCSRQVCEVYSENKDHFLEKILTDWEFFYQSINTDSAYEDAIKIFPGKYRNVLDINYCIRLNIIRYQDPEFFFHTEK